MTLKMQKFYKQLTWLLSIMFLCTTPCSAQYSCVTPYNTYGRCVPYHQCELLKLLQVRYGSLLPERYKNDIVKARCKDRRNSNTIHLCCDETISLAKLPGADAFEAKLNLTGLRVLLEQNCGRTQGLDMGSSRLSLTAGLFEIPWLALLRYNVSGDAVATFKCSGTLVTSNQFLTAAHCINDKIKITGVRLGEYNLATDEDCVNTSKGTICAPLVEDYGISKIIIHPDFNVKLIPPSPDLALIKLDRPVVFKRHILPICLPINQQMVDELEMAKELYVAHWTLSSDSAFPNVLRKSLVPIVQRKECMQIKYFQRLHFAEHHVCAGGNGNFATLRGDFGGPLYGPPKLDNSDEQSVQYGIVSTGTDDSHVPDIYVNIIHFMPWITSNIN